MWSSSSSFTHQLVSIAQHRATRDLRISFIVEQFYIHIYPLYLKMRSSGSRLAVVLHLQLRLQAHRLEDEEGEGLQAQSF